MSLFFICIPAISILFIVKFGVSCSHKWRHLVGVTLVCNRKISVDSISVVDVSYPLEDIDWEFRLGLGGSLLHNIVVITITCFVIYYVRWRGSYLAVNFLSNEVALTFTLWFFDDSVGDMGSRPFSSGWPSDACGSLFFIALASAICAALSCSPASFSARYAGMNSWTE